MWNFNKYFFLQMYFYRYSLYELDNFDDFFNMIDILDNLFHLLKDSNFFNNSIDFNNLSRSIINLNNSFLLNLNLSDSLNDPGYFNKSFNNFLNVLVDSDDLRNDFIDLYDFRHFNQFRNDLLDLINTRNSCWTFDYLLYYLLSCYYLLHFWLNCYDLLYHHRDLFYHLVYVRNYPLNLLNTLINHYLLYHFLNVLNSHILLFRFDYFLDELRHLDDSLHYLTNWNAFLSHYLNWNRNLQRYNNWPFYLYRFNYLIVSRNYFIHINRSWHLSNDLNYILYFYLVSNNFFLYVIDGHKLINKAINRFFNLNIYIFDDFYLNDSLLYDRNLNFFLDFSYDNFLNFSDNNFFYNLWYFNDFLYDPRHYDNFLDDPLDLDDFRHFNNFFNDFLDFNSHLFYSLHVSRNFYYLLFDISHRFRHFNVMIYNFLDLYYLWLMNYQRIT